MPSTICNRKGRFYFILLLIPLFIHSRQGEGQTTPYLDSLLMELNEADPDFSNIDLLLEIGMLYTDIDPVEGLTYGRRAKQISLQKNNPIDIARSNNIIGSNMLILTEMDSAMKYYSEALSIYEQEDDKKGKGEIAGNMGHVAYYNGKFDEALNYYLQALYAFEEIGFTAGVVNQHASLANTYMIQEKYDEAIHHDSIALAGFTQLKDSMGIAMVLGNLGNIYDSIKKRDTAAVYFQQAIDYYERMNQPMGIGRNLVNVAAVHNEQHHYAEALEAARKAVAICGDNNIEYCVPYALSNIGSAYLGSYLYRDSARAGITLIPGSDDELLSQAVHYLEQAVKLTDKLSFPAEYEDAHHDLAIAYKYQGRFEKALEHYEIYAALNDSLSSAERAERIERLTTEREIAVRDKQIELDTLRLKVKRQERIYFIIGLVLLAGWLAWVYRNAMNQRKANLQLGLLNGQISSANLQLEDRNEKLTSTLEELRATQDQLIESERQKENEILRQRISRDIHDDISSGLSKISWMTEILRNPAQANDGANTDILNRIASYSRETVSKLGEIIWSTKPESDNVSSLVSYSREFLSRYLEGLPIRYHLDFPHEDPNIALNPELRRNLYLVLKEAVHNAVKYSQAQDLFIRLQFEDGKYHLKVEDNGVGMDLHHHPMKGNGFRNMQSRMHDVGGKMSLQSSPGKGTRIECSGHIY